MPARTKGRARFDFRGRAFVWCGNRAYRLRVSSLDKKFVIASALWRAADTPPVVGVRGFEFPGIDRNQPLPVWLVAPELGDPRGPGSSMGPLVEHLLSWSFDPGHE